MTLEWKKTSRLTFGAVLLCSLLPFVSVTCQGQRLATLTGIQLVSGTTIHEPTGFDAGSGKAHRMNPEPLVIAAYGFALIGLLISLTPGTGQSRPVAAIAGLGSVCLLIARARIDSQASEAGFVTSGLTLEYELGFWIPLLLFCLTTILAARAVRGGARAAAFQTASP